MKSRTWRTAAGCLAMVAGLAGTAVAEFPDRPITLIVAVPAGDSADLSTRALAKAAQGILKQPVVVTNRPGGGATVGTAAIASAKPDGYTLGTLLTSPLVTIPHFMKLTYDPVKDIQPILQFGILKFALATRADSPFKNVKEFLAYAREHPGVVTYGTVGPTSAQYIVMQQIAKEEKIELVHVPFKGGGEAFSAALGGHITASAGFFAPGQVRAGKAKLIALFGDQRIEEYPDVPTLKELGYQVNIPYFIGVGAPRGIPEQILKKLEEAFTAAMKDPGFLQTMKSIEMPVKHRSGADFARYLAEGYKSVAQYVEELGLKK